MFEGLAEVVRGISPKALLLCEGVTTWRSRASCGLANRLSVRMAEVAALNVGSMSPKEVEETAFLRRR